MDKNWNVFIYIEKIWRILDLTNVEADQGFGVIHLERGFIDFKIFSPV